MFLKCDVFSTFLITSVYIPIKLNEPIFDVFRHDNIENFAMETFY